DAPSTHRLGPLPVPRDDRRHAPRGHALLTSPPMRDYDKLFIGGEWIDPAGTATIDVISPHSEELVGRVPEGTEADIDRAVAAARDAFDNGEWSRMQPAERASIVQKFADVYATQMMDMAAIITEEMGSPISFSQLAQS